MSWLYSRALVEEYSEACCSDGEPSVRSSLTPTPQAYWSHGKTTAHSRLSRYGMTLERLTDDRGEELLTWYRAGFRAKTSAQPARAQALTESAADYGGSSRGFLGRFDRVTHSLKTAQCSLLVDSTECLQILPRWGSMRDGELYRQPTLARLTSARESGSLAWQTPTADDAIDRRAGKWNSRGEPKLSAQVKLWPTPRANDAEKRGNFDATNPRNGLAAAVRLPTPTATDANKWNNDTAAKRRALGRSVRLSNMPILPTPTVNDAKNNGSASPAMRSSPNLNSVIGGKLNPRWVELLMDWPMGWSDLSPLPKSEFLAWRFGHGEEDRSDEAMSTLRGDVDAQGIQRAHGGLRTVSQSEVLQQIMRELPQASEALVNLSLAIEETQRVTVRSVRQYDPLASSSCESGCGEQRSIEPADAVQAVSRLLARYGKEAWQSGSWEDAIARTVEGMKHRVGQLRALGNGQVPAVARLAWEVLTS